MRIKRYVPQPVLAMNFKEAIGLRASIDHVIQQLSPTSNLSAG